MNTRKLLALGTLLTLTSLAGAGFAADQKAAAKDKPAAPAPTAPAASTAQAPTAEPGTPAKPAKKHKKKHSAEKPETKG